MITPGTTVHEAVTDFNNPATSTYFSAKTVTASWLGTGSYTLVSSGTVKSGAFVYIWFDSSNTAKAVSARLPGS